MLGIKDYNPTFYSNIEELISYHGQKLSSLIGYPIEEVWTVHEASDNEWWRDCPIVLIINGIQIEICVFNDRDFAITWNEIKLKEKLVWYGNNDIELEWRKNSISKIETCIAKPIDRIEIIEMGQDSYDGSDKLLQSELILNGIGFQLNDNYLAITNAFDEIDISSERNANLKYRSL